MNNLSFSYYQKNKDFLFRKSLFLDEFHFPIIPNTTTEFYNLNAANFRFEQEDVRLDCDRQAIFFELVNLSGMLPTCRQNTRYQWFIDGNFEATTDAPRLSIVIPPALIPTSNIPLPISNTIRVVIEKLDENGNWIAVADINDIYGLNYVEPPYDCNGNEFGLGKIAVKDKEEFNSAIIFYPNPTSTEFNIQSSEKVKEVTITNSLGQLLLTTKKSKSVSIETLSKGIYFVIVTLESGEVKIQKLIIN